MPRPLLTDLQPGDVLAYASPGFFNRIIAIKTWCRDCTHTETYIGNGLSAASRNGQGVNTYGTRLDHLTYVLRPKEPFDIKSALDWHNGCKGQAYDFWGLLIFILAAKQGSQTKMFCSEHSTRFARQGGIVPFSEDTDADRIAPSEFLKSTAYWRVWRRGRL